MAAKKVFVPSAADVEVLISRVSVVSKAFLCLLRDTGAKPYELGTLLFQDISVPDSTVTLTRKNQQRIMHISVETVNLVLALHHRRCKKIISSKTSWEYCASLNGSKLLWRLRILGSRRSNLKVYIEGPAWN